MGSRKYYFLILLLVPILISVSLVDEAFAPYHKQPQQPMSVSTDKISYNFGDFLTINGQGAESYSISIIILSPSGEEITELSTFKTSAGEFSTIWIIPSGIEKGMYTIEARDSTQTAQTTFSLGKLEVKPQPEQSESKAAISEWIKNNAKWWSEGLIGDSDFVSGIQYLMKEKVIDIPDLPEQASETAQEHVPDWIRNNAGWWAEGLISEEDFLNGIKYLVEQGIIKV
ncbi:MAG: hypothetical protein NPMRTHETA2_70004 [Nitrosopumilales archaeon]|nr:MAG: hypothetical protein NPMRTHETA2_70004 [Nitrosopumilales archaeon]